MLYKTIVLELLQQRPRMHEQLRKGRQLLPALDRYARELKAIHLELAEQLAQARPGKHPDQIRMEAMEMAVAEFVDRLPSESPPSDDPLSLDQAMAFLRRHSRPE